MAKNPSRNQKRRVKWFDENPTCQICQLTIEKFEDSTIEHIVPRWFGGHSWVWNTALAHYKCNQAENYRALKIYKEVGDIQKARHKFIMERPNLTIEFWNSYCKRRFKGDKYDYRNKQGHWRDYKLAQRNHSGFGFQLADSNAVREVSQTD